MLLDLLLLGLRWCGCVDSDCLVGLMAYVCCLVMLIVLTGLVLLTLCWYLFGLLSGFMICCFLR